MQSQTDTIRNYRNLVAKVDEFSHRISSEYGNLIFCRKGCDGCCRQITLFPVEAYALASELRRAPEEVSARIRKRSLKISPDACPLLEDGICLLYPARPIICRTHGIPILIAGDHEKTIDFCPKNFMGVASFPAADILNLDLLNSTLSLINRVFTSSCEETVWRSKDRFSISEALLIVF
jgi:uncharacterized protein